MHSRRFQGSPASAAITIALLLCSGVAAALAADVPPPTTPPDLVATYNAVADGILAMKKTEANLVRSILGTTYGHAQGALARAKGSMKAGDNAGAQSAIEALAAYVSQLATEGDASVAGIRKRLLEGGHHHNAKGEQEGVYDEGFVVVTKKAKTAFLDSSKAIGAMAKSPNASGLDAEWKKVESTYTSLGLK
jgi:hypothetical protein